MAALEESEPFFRGRNAPRGANACAANEKDVFCSTQINETDREKMRGQLLGRRRSVSSRPLNILGGRCHVVGLLYVRPRGSDILLLLR